MYVSELYPTISYLPELRHCAFGFNGLFKIAPGFEIPTDKNLSKEELVRLSNDFYEHRKKLLPSSKDLVDTLSSEELKFCQRFSGLDEKIIYIEDEKNNSRIIITLPAKVYAPSLRFDIEDGSFLEVNLHNCANADMAVIMYTQGLNALRKTYEAYGINTNFLPELRFDLEGIQIQVPFKVPKSEHLLKKADIRDRLTEYLFNRCLTKTTYTGYGCKKIEIFHEHEYFGRVSIGGIAIEPVFNYEGQKDKETVVDGRFISRIPLTLPPLKRNSIAMDLLLSAIIQSENMYHAIDYSE
jgi:hypothetical protein